MIVAVIIKLAKSRSINVQQLVLWNYPMTVVMTYFLLKPDLHSVLWTELPYSLYIPLIFLLPTLFIFIALAIRYSGIVKTDVAQRMSLFIPLLASFLLFGETSSAGKLIGVGVGLIAVIFSVSWDKSNKTKGSVGILYPIIVFLGMGLVDILFKQIAQHKEVSYINSLFFVFVGAMLVSFFILLFQWTMKRRRFTSNTVLWGSILGLFNFANIFFYMRAHRAIPDNPSIVFTVMNVGVIVVGSLVGIWIFKEKLSLINKIGLLLAVISIILITYL